MLYFHVPNCRRAIISKGGLSCKINKRKVHNKRGGLVQWEITLKGWGEQ